MKNEDVPDVTGREGLPARNYLQVFPWMILANVNTEKDFYLLGYGWGVGGGNIISGEIIYFSD